MTKTQETEFNLMYSELFPKMVKYANTLCRNREEAEDIAQEAFIKAYKSFDKVNQTFRIDNWLMKIVYNTFLDIRRMKNRRLKPMGETVEGTDLTIADMPDAGPSPEDLVVGSVMDPEIARALRNLDPHSRELFEKAVIEERNQIELSREMGIEAGTLRSRLHRICARLRKDIYSNKMAKAL